MATWFILTWRIFQGWAGGSEGVALANYHLLPPQCGPGFLLGTGVADIHHQYGNAGIVCMNGLVHLWQSEESVLEALNETGPGGGGCDRCTC